MQIRGVLEENEPPAGDLLLAALATKSLSRPLSSRRTCARARSRCPPSMSSLARGTTMAGEAVRMRAAGGRAAAHLAARVGVAHLRWWNCGGTGAAVEKKPCVDAVARQVIGDEQPGGERREEWRSSASSGSRRPLLRPLRLPQTAPLPLLHSHRKLNCKKAPSSGEHSE